jgi:radical SAM superfamily enzyme YgiQ (UPF0313 family)
VRYEGKLYRPPSEARSYILQATIGCSWNHCVYCDMYRDKQYRLRSIEESLEDLEEAARISGGRIDKIFVADGDALGMPMDHWRAILESATRQFPRLERVSCYAMASNILEKDPDELTELGERGLSLLYIGPESGDDVTLKRIAKGATAADHVEAARRAHGAGLAISVITMLGVAGTERSKEHAERTAELVTAMDPEYLAALTTTVVPGTPLLKLVERDKFRLPTIERMLEELRTLVDRARPTSALFRTNHASNYLPLQGRLPDDRSRIVQTIDAALDGSLALRPEWSRGL